MLGEHGASSSHARAPGATADRSEALRDVLTTQDGPKTKAQYRVRAHVAVALIYTQRTLWHTDAEIGSRLRSSTILGATLIFAALGTSPAVVQSQTANAEEATGDAWLTSKTKIALFADERVKDRQLSVETRHGVVTLRGKVESDEVKAAASSIASGIPGVTRVRNDLQVVSPALRKSVDVGDDEITRRVEGALAQDMRPDRVNVRTDAGMVTLTGEVSTIGAGVHAFLIARELSGVRSVNNRLIYAPALSTHDESIAPRPARVMAMQQALRDRGYDPGTIDGIMGRKTASALRRYQELENLGVTGRMDPQTAAKLKI